jgi:UDP-N-acetylenolpyruvoylglucosamine reductase
MLWRRENQPQKLNTGSILKNPPNLSAETRIDRVRLKSTGIDGTEISTKIGSFYRQCNRPSNGQ